MQVTDIIIDSYEEKLFKKLLGLHRELKINGKKFILLAECGDKYCVLTPGKDYKLESTNSVIIHNTDYRKAIIGVVFKDNQLDYIQKKLVSDHSYKIYNPVTDD